jgi:ribosomal protein L10
MKSKGKKEEELNDLKKDLAEAKNLILAQFQGITVGQDTELRSKIRATRTPSPELPPRARRPRSWRAP